MSLSAARLGVPVQTWTSAKAGVGERLEVVDGKLVVKKVGGNPHHRIAARLALEFEDQWPDAYAAAPGNWAITLAPDGTVVHGRIPDVLVDGPSLNEDAVCTQLPRAAVEVWSPSNTLAEMNDKRSEYRRAHLPVLLEAYLTAEQQVHLEWLLNTGDKWLTIATAVGDAPLHVPASDAHPAFGVVPNDLLGRGRT
ncbi:Uma2 family endonuclease [Kineococcus sp. SYSU DK004]|uniref:Uma2 family endonuclease n=1 Tax=Kineococcus sp. SYSU DK004 TaxID=3383125 RepID=UPI003D7C797C